MSKIEILNEHGFSVKVLADSNAYGTRITTLELVYPRFIHSEMLTHRAFSRNASSSRAIPVERMLENCDAVPIHWGANKPGMSAEDEVDDVAGSLEVWLSAAESSAYNAHRLSTMGVHKQVANRLTEPFQFIKVVVTSTEWENFFTLRNHEAAQPEMHEIASMMQSAMEQSEPKEFEDGDWHVPYYHEGFWQNTGNGMDLEGNSAEHARIVSAAGCARVSYDNHDGSETDIEKDTKLYKMLKDMGHMSPFEHQASPAGLRAVNITEEFEFIFEEGVTHFGRDGKAWSGNFCDWIQLRQMGSFQDGK